MNLYKEKAISKIAVMTAAILSVSACARQVPYESIVQDYRIENRLEVYRGQEKFLLTAKGENVFLPERTHEYENFINDFHAKAEGRMEVLIPFVESEGNELSKKWANDVVSELNKENISSEQIALRIVKVPEKDCYNPCDVRNVSTCKPRPILLRYNAYKVKLPQCGDWSAQHFPSDINQPHPNFGCATQRNIGAMVANPRDLVYMRKKQGRMADRSVDILEKYATGSATASAGELDSVISSVGGE